MTKGYDTHTIPRDERRQKEPGGQPSGLSSAPSMKGEERKKQQTVCLATSECLGLLMCCNL